MALIAVLHRDSAEMATFEEILFCHGFVNWKGFCYRFKICHKTTKLQKYTHILCQNIIFILPWSSVLYLGTTTSCGIKTWSIWNNFSVGTFGMTLTYQYEIILSDTDIAKFIWPSVLYFIGTCHQYGWPPWRPLWPPYFSGRRLVHPL